MKILKAYKFRLEPTQAQVSTIVDMAGACRFVWNKALRMNLSRLEAKQKILWNSELCFWLKMWKDSEDYGWLKDADSQALQQKLADLDRAFKDAFDKNQPLKRIPGAPLVSLPSEFSRMIRVNQQQELEQSRNPLSLWRGGCQIAIGRFA